MADKENTEGYDYDFVEEPPDSLKCLICLLVVREPQQHGDCGRLFCKACITRHRQQKSSCPYCRRPLTGENGYPTIFRDARSDQEVKSLSVWCKTGCGWRGELRSVKDHVEKECMNTLVPCPNSCDNGSKKIARKNLEAHLQMKCPKRLHQCYQCDKVMEFRQCDHHSQNECPKRLYYCPNCNETGTYEERTTTHLIDCPKVKVTCTKCSLKMNRCDQASHPAICQYEPVRCQYYNIGCGEWPLRKDALKHESDAQLHLDLAKGEVLRLKNMLLLKNTLTFKVENYYQNLKEKSQQYLTSPLFTSKLGYKICLEVKANGEGTHVSVFVYLMKGDNDDSLSWPFTGTVTVELLNQLEDDDHYKMTLPFPADHEAGQRVVDGERGQGWGWPQFISHAELKHNPLINCQYLKDDSLVFRVSAEAHDYKPWLECND